MWFTLALGCLAAQLAMIGLLLVVEMLPWVALAAGEGAARAAAAAIAAAMASLAAILLVARAPLAAALLEPFAALVFVYACVRGGIVWRGTSFYRLAELRRNEV